LSIILKWKKHCENNKSSPEDFVDFIEKNQIKFKLIDSICFCEKSNIEYIFYYAKNNKIIIKNISFNDKRKFSNIVENFEIIITKNFGFDIKTFKNKTILRYEVINNFICNSNIHFLSEEIYSLKTDFSIFLTEECRDLIYSNLEYYKYSSLLYNHFEIGHNYGGIILKPNIRISNYGRWYWSGTLPIQNNISNRQKLYSKLINSNANIINLDFISGEPVVFSQLANSSILNKLIKYRAKIKKTNFKLADAIKNLLNIFIHANYKKADYNKLNSLININLIEKELKISILDIFECLQDDFLCYNRYVIDKYKSDLIITELQRRIFNSEIPFMTDNKIIKEHRKYLQGHVHDNIIDLSMKIYNEVDILPIFTIHDSISYCIYDQSKIKLVKQIVKGYNVPTSIEVIKKLKEE